MENVCEKLQEIIKKHGFKIMRVKEDDNICLIDFRHPKIKVETPEAYYGSAVQYDKKRKVLTTAVRSKVEGFKELYLDYCCEKENGECLQMCRPHVHMDFKTLSVEATFFKDPIKKFDRLLEEMR